MHSCHRHPPEAHPLVILSKHQMTFTFKMYFALKEGVLFSLHLHLLKLKSRRFLIHSDCIFHGPQINCTSGVGKKGFCGLLSWFWRLTPGCPLQRGLLLARWAHAACFLVIFMASAAHPLVLDFGSVLSWRRFGAGSGGGDFLYGRAWNSIVGRKWVLCCTCW